ncbi:hypothetical protein L6452_28395 [Arctium lappa]|uniref:Uncharacterized protein n=1 Tax=Arctium lappa TaxID=4217 RepID=A0ACB8ZXR3_ARCLA|nr:hypothetical protein L6452_28395 [Arctium lappa]
MELMRRNQELMEQIMSGAMGMNSPYSTASGNLWLFDSGCCNHMTPCTDGFVSKKPPEHFTSVRTADNTDLSVSFSGNVSTPHIQLPDVLNIPKLSLSLVSIAQLLESNLIILFHSSGCVVQDPKTKQILGLGRKIGRMIEVVYLPSWAKKCQIVRRGLARDSARDSDRMSQSRRHNRRGSRTLGTSLAIVPCESDRVTIAGHYRPDCTAGGGCWRDYARESDKCHSRRVTIAGKRFGDPTGLNSSFRGCMFKATEPDIPCVYFMCLLALLTHRMAYFCVPSFGLVGGSPPLTQETMVNTRNRPEGQDTAASTADQPRVTNNDLPPPFIDALGGGPEHVPRRNIATTHPVMEEVTPEARMMERMMQAMNAAMAQQQEAFLKLLDDRDANHRRPETVEENVIVAGSGGSGPRIPTNETANPSVRPEARSCTFKAFLGCRPPEFKGTDNPVECMN